MAGMNHISIKAPTSKRYLGRTESQIGYWIYTDSLGCEHLAEESCGRWSRVSASEVAREMNRCANLYSDDIAAQIESGAPACTYQYMYGRRDKYSSLRDAIVAAFPSIKRVPITA
jgi:hypothetical protein